MAYAPPFVYSKVTGDQVADRRRSRGLADLGGRDAQGDHEPQPGVHLPPPARRGAHGHGASARRSWGSAPSPRWSATPASPSRARAAADHHGQQLQRLRRAVGRARRACCASAWCRWPKRGEQVQFKAMVVGATGAIGSVCARLLAMVAEEVYMVSPETAKLLSLKESILQGDAGREARSCPRAPTRTSPTWT